MSNRVFYACQAVSLDGTALAGVQSIDVNTDQSVIPLSHFGTLEMYKVVPNLPKLSITLSRILNRLNYIIYSGTLEDNINKHDYNLCLFIGEDTNKNTIDSLNLYNISYRFLSINSLNYEFNTDGTFKETIEFVGSNKEFDYSGCMPGSLSGLSSGSPSKTRQHFIVVSGISNELNIQSVSIGVSFNVQEIEEFGSNVYKSSLKRKYCPLPIETQCSFTAVIKSGGQIGINSYGMPDITGCGYTGLVPTKALNFDLCGISIALDNCMLENINYRNGGTDGSNAELEFSYKGFNYFTIRSSGSG
jgi:hypothetical protein